MLNTRFSRRSLLAVHVTEGWVNVLLLRSFNQRYILDFFHRERCSPVGVSALLRHHILPKLPYRVRYAVTAVPDSQIVCKRVLYPEDLSEAEIGAQIIVDADDIIPFPLANVCYDFHQLGADAGQAGQQSVLLIIARRQLVEECQAWFADTSLSLRIVDIASCAYARACHWLSLPETWRNQRLLVVNVDGSKITWVLVHNGFALFFKETTLPEDSQLGQKLAMSEVILAELRTEATDKPITHVVLAGDVMHQHEWLDIWQQALGLQTVVANPFVNMPMGRAGQRLPSDAVAAHFFLCSGLAVRAFQ